MKCTSMFCAVAVLACAGASTAQAANLLSNPSFESGAFMPNYPVGGVDQLPQGSTSITGWTVTNSDIFWLKNGNGFNLNASNGQYSLDLTGDENNGQGGVMQTAALTAGATYQLTFDLGASTRFNPTSLLRVSLGDATIQSGDGTPDGTGSEVFSFTSTSGDQYGAQTLNFIANGAMVPITFQAAGGLQYVGLDNTSLTQISAAPVSAAPEPSSWLLMIAGAGAIGLVLRRQRKICEAPERLAACG